MQSADPIQLLTEWRNGNRAASTSSFCWSATTCGGEPRLTRDIDLVIQLERRDARRFAQAWPAADFYVPPVEVLEEESRRPAYSHFNVSHHQTTLRADVYLPGSDALNAWTFEHKVVRRIDAADVFVAPIEAVILSKSRIATFGTSVRC